MCNGEMVWLEVDRQVEQWLDANPNWLDEPTPDDPILAKLYREREVVCNKAEDFA